MCPRPSSFLLQNPSPATHDLPISSSSVRSPHFRHSDDSRVPHQFDRPPWVASRPRTPPRRRPRPSGSSTPRPRHRPPSPSPSTRSACPRRAPTPAVLPGLRAFVPASPRSTSVSSSPRRPPTPRPWFLRPTGTSSGETKRPSRSHLRVLTDAVAGGKYG
ncbi:hypothetical protein JOL62DRAFT_11193 [Phyllosticta paracitricarpa]|uniref:Uncharacterized protein n=1 Tax=Phyllosticta paracitricarpa TaxID=2016321 RepID=A0ABR1NK64_9PEZI